MVKNFYKRGGLGQIGVRKKHSFFENFVITERSELEQQPLIDKVNEILSLKSQDPLANTLALEQEIDAIVYELYGLSEEEIGVVEGSI